jgi:threonine dehydrogenase-like Zn-dependent dehydrogenase
MARGQGAEAIDFNADDPVEIILRLTGGIGPDRAIDAVGVDATQPHGGPAASGGKEQASRFQKEVQEVAPKVNPRGDNWHPGDAIAGAHVGDRVVG